MEWYYTKAKKQTGPVSLEELVRKISVGEVSSNDYAWREGLADWQPISSIPELHITSKSAGGGPPAVPTHSTISPQSPPGKSNTSGLAIASLCLGIGSILLCGLLLGIPAVICGHMALGQIKRSGDKLEGKTVAVIGLITGYLSILATVGMILFFVFVTNSVMEHEEERVMDIMQEQYEDSSSFQPQSEELVEPSDDEFLPEPTQ